MALVKPKLIAPFPYFGSKRRIAPEVWARFGTVGRYIEPFFGSGAVLLANPAPARVEIINDRSGAVSNFWRAVKADPHAVAYSMDNPANHTDLIAWRPWIDQRLQEVLPLLESDPDFYDSTLAGRCAWNWSSSLNAFRRAGKSRPLHQHQGSNHPDRDPLKVCLALAKRLRHTIVFCTDWTGALTPGCLALTRCRKVGVFLDPPYSTTVRDKGLYHVDSADVASKVVEWCREHGDNPRLRIALCGYETEGHGELLPGWDCLAWQGVRGLNRNQENAGLERIWFSPGCRV